MANSKTTVLAEVTTVDDDDLTYVVDVSDTTMAATGTNKKVPVSTLVPLSRIMSGIELQAIVFGPADDQINVSDGKKSRPRVGYVTVSGLPKFHLAGAVNVTEGGDTPELILRRWNGDAETRTPALTTRAGSIADITVATSITTTDLADGTDAWPNTGTIQVQDASGTGTAKLTYSSINRSTGVLSGLTLVWQSQIAFDAGDTVHLALTAGTTVGIIYAQPDQGKGGFQQRTGIVQFELAEDHTADGYGNDYAGNNIVIGTTSPGPNSQRRDHLVLRSNGFMGLLGSHGADKTDIDRRLVVSAKHTRTAAQVTLPVATIPVLDPSGFPASGNVLIDGNTVAYTAYSATDGVWNLTGCTGGTGTIASGTNVELAKDTVGTVIGAHGQIAACDWGDNQTTTIGAIGPSATPEAGIRAGASGPRWYRRGNDEWGSDNAVFVKRTGGAAGVKVGADTDTEARVEIRPGGIRFGPGGVTTCDILIKRQSSTEVAFRDAGDTADVGAKLDRVRMVERTDPSAPSANEGVVYMRDNGAGKTQLVVRFNSGAVQVIATEP
jgi:hypothetical protein